MCPAQKCHFGRTDKGKAATAAEIERKEESEDVQAKVSLSGFC